MTRPRVWVTRSESPGGPLSRALEDHGLEPVLEPVIQRRVIADISAGLAELGQRDWLVITSTFAAAAIRPERVRCRIAAVGEGTAQAARANGWQVHRISPDGTGAALFRSLLQDPDGARTILYPRSTAAPDPHELNPSDPDAPGQRDPIARAEPTGVRLLSPAFYETATRPFDQSVARRVAAAAIASPSAAGPVAAIQSPPPCASIGPTTSKALREAGIEPMAEAPKPTFTDLARAIADTLNAPHRSAHQPPDPQGP